ncbi:MAG: hypothetical protein N2Z20_02455 [Elusimicrobiales bacterium]|nr:hypothetical protein [Elusimicrobiales bacterium]
MKNAVLKFGGSSISNSDKLFYVATRIKEHLNIYDKLIVILSAPSNITDDLIKLSNNISNKLSPPPSLLQIGELLSISLMQHALKRKKVKAIALNHYQLSIIGTGDMNNAKIISVNKKKIYQYFTEYDVLLIPGFIACDKNLNVMTLGRGGSDYTATYMAYILSSPCYLYTDIKGIYSADPSNIEDALKIKKISYDELNNIIKYATQVRQTKAIKFAFQKKLELYIGSTFHPDEKPTLITQDKYDKKIKFINMLKYKNSTIIHMIGNYIEKRDEIFKEILSNIKNSRIKKYKDIIEIKTTTKLSKEDFRKIHNKFVFR